MPSWCSRRHRSIAKTSGVPIDEAFAIVWTVADGRSCVSRCTADRAQALEAVGLLPFQEDLPPDGLAITQPEERGPDVARPRGRCAVRAHRR